MAAVFNIRSIPDEVHRGLKVEAAKRGIPLRVLVIRILSEWLARETKRKK